MKTIMRAAAGSLAALLLASACGSGSSLETEIEKFSACRLLKAEPALSQQEFPLVGGEVCGERFAELLKWECGILKERRRFTLSSEEDKCLSALEVETSAATWAMLEAKSWAGHEAAQAAVIEGLAARLASPPAWESVSARQREAESEALACLGSLSAEELFEGLTTHRHLLISRCREAGLLDSSPLHREWASSLAGVLAEQAADAWEEAEEEFLRSAFGEPENV